MKIAIIIIHYGQVKTTRECLSKLKEKIGTHQLVLINNTQDDLSSLSNIIPHTLLINNKKNLGFARAVNQGIKKASQPDIGAYLLMNNDLSITFSTFDQLAKTFIDKRTSGIVSPVLHHGGNLYDWGGRYSRWTGLVKHRNFAQKPKTILSVDHVAGAAMLIKKEVVEKIGLLDDRYFLYFEDLDYCLRAKQAGYTVHINPEVVAEHMVSASSSPLSRTLYQWRSHFQFVVKHLPRTVFPTAFAIDLLFYPLILLKLFLFK